MNRNGGQELIIQLETALHRLVESFWEEPYRFFTEADAVAALQFWVARRPGLAQVLRTADGFETGLLHREYPTFFLFSKSKPDQKKGQPARRGHYDLVLIDPAYVQRHAAETVINRDIRNQGDLTSPPLLAVIEFKLFARGWSPRRVRGVKQNLSKLQLALQFEEESSADASAAYMCIFQRAVGTTQERWKQYWEKEVKPTLVVYPKIRTVVAVCWPDEEEGWEREPFVHYSGSWITTVTS